MILSSLHIFRIALLLKQILSVIASVSVSKSMNSDLAQHFVGLGLHRISADDKKGLLYLLRYEQSLGTEIHHFIEILTCTKIQNEYFPYLLY